MVLRRVERKWRLFFREQLWFLQRIPAHGLVLDVGSGLSPCIRANVLCEKFALDDSERAGSLIADRPLVLGDVEALPFRDHAFDYVVCSQVLEHVARPELAMKELQRVSRRGRIDTPGLLSEMIGGESFHLWYTSIQNGELVFQEKPRPLHDERIAAFTRQLKEQQDSAFEELVFTHYDWFVTVYSWKDEIRFRVERIEEGMASRPVESKASIRTEDLDRLRDLSRLERWRARPPWQWRRARDAKDWIKALLSKRYQTPVNLLALIACPTCKGPIEKTDAESLFCRNCALYYPLFGDIPGLLQEYSQAVMHPASPAS